MDILGDIWGYIAGICTAICFLPQTIRTIRSHNVEGLSLLSYAIYALGMFCWILYGLHLTALPMIIFNTPALLFALIIIYQIVLYKGKIR
jgi:MtN3 and saliva related transmembrane protein